MLDDTDAGLLISDHDDLVSGHSPWGSAARPPRRQKLTESIKVDVAVIGGGITGALSAQHLTSLGLSVCVIDREKPGLGSTSASTAMLQWEIDARLSELTEYYGFERAAAIYRRSHAAVSGLGNLVTGLGLDCAFVPRSTLYITGEEQEPGVLMEEAALRQRAGLPSVFLSAGELRGQFGIARNGALHSPGSAEADPLCMAWGLMRAAMAAGARLVEASAEAFHEEGGRVTVETDGPFVVEARHAVLATGYIMPGFVMPEIHKIASSWAIATVSQAPDGFWPEQALIWEASDPYLYLRGAAGNRIIVGGEDEDTDDPDERDAKLPRKAEILLEKLHRLWPRARPEIAYAWCGAFGETEDGLPLIGRVPGTERIFAAYGYGGNGITFSYMAARMAGAFIFGQQRDWFDDFALDRPSP